MTDNVKLPTTADEATLMVLLGMDYLVQHAPERLKQFNHIPKRVEEMSVEEHCRMFCAWKGGGPCLAEDCPRAKSDCHHHQGHYQSTIEG